ncbi:MAG TPA: thrombospondin type 3 repeat-containing protein, partial [Polyangia bacterium]|nr:thrombospondin type 3 repeat-containing protein [Polyangia bacterium]
MRACALVALGLAACSSSTTSVLVQASLDVPDQVAAPLTVSLFDPRGALIDHTATRAVTLPVRVVLTGVPSRAEDVRVVLTRSTTPPWLGGARVTVIPDGEAQVAVVLSQHTADADADGIPDSVDNCPNVANPDQASASGGAGDACASDAGLGDLPGDGPDGGPLGGPYTFVPTVPQHQSLYYGGHDPPPATVTFTYVADAIACSHDGGAHYAACDGAHAIVFTPADYNQNHTLAVKLSKAGLADFVWTFQPSALEPGLHFYDCDQVVTADESADAFAARLAPNRVVCVSGGVTVRDATMHNDDAGQHINTTGIFLTDTNSTGVKVIGTEANR